MAKGDYDQVVPAMTRDELGELAGGVQHDGPADPRVSTGGDGAAGAGAADGTGDDRLVPRSGRRRRSGRCRRAGQPGGTPDLACDIDQRVGPVGRPGFAAACPDRGAQRPARPLAGEPGSCPLPSRRRPGAVLPASSPGDSRRRWPAGGRGGASGRDQVPPGRPAQERHGLDRQPRAEDAADERPDGHPPAAGGGRRPAHAQAGRAACWPRGRSRTGCSRWSTTCST